MQVCCQSTAALQCELKKTEDQYALTASLSSLWPGVSSGAGLPDIHWLPPLCPLEVLPHPSAKETKVSSKILNV